VSAGDEFFRAVAPRRCDCGRVADHDARARVCSRCAIRAAVDNGDHDEAYTLACEHGVAAVTVREYIRDEAERQLREAARPAPALDWSDEDGGPLPCEFGYEAVRIPPPPRNPTVLEGAARERVYFVADRVPCGEAFSPEGATVRVRGAA
jgi:hypothetical protein